MSCMIRPATSRPNRFAARVQWMAIPIALLLTACATVTPPSSQPAVEQPSTVERPRPTPHLTSAGQEALQALIAQQDRLYRVAAPLLVKNTDLCRSQARNLLGFTAKNQYSYSSEFVGTAQKMLGLDGRLQVMGVLAGSGAAKAGVRRGDILISMEDKPMPEGENAERQAATMLAPLVIGRSSIRMTVARDGAMQTLTIPLTYACAFGVELGNTDNVTAYADGHRVLVTRGMMNAAASDDELAYVLAKEMAHNALMHARRQHMSATIGDIIDNLIRLRPDMSTMVGLSGVKPMPKELDAMADKLSLYMLARAGYSIERVVPFWQRMASQYPATVLTGYTSIHPATEYRIEAMEKAIRDIKAKQAGKRPLLP